MHVVLAGGGTAGHIEPALALADALRRQDPSVGITALGTERGLETRLVPERGYELALIPAVPLPRKPTPELITVPGRLRGTIKAAEQILERTKADCVVGFGGYVALPGYLAAKRAGVPIVVHEANARPGLANKIGSRYAHGVAVSTPDSKLRGARYIGIPLRRTIATLDRARVRPEARNAFGLDPNLPTLLVSGGSQGARHLNEVVQRVAPLLQRSGIQILHVVGPKNEMPRVDNMPGMPPYIPVPYVDRMDLAYAAADMMLCRAGAMTVAELSAVGRDSLDTRRSAVGAVTHDGAHGTCRKTPSAPARHGSTAATERHDWTPRRNHWRVGHVGGGMGFTIGGIRELRSGA
ncbi:glycosyltransferase, partial [Streptomyces sp. NPDC058427]|uniref:UDP-N-acetylglucosamine--N-acetylmuramyl- (pentapeptide) pyrophosphoryl-undecaprenol N-acetylglucosamine transferase n=1 Tax=Streptomyces sp. NPDC058427 TaxID=3346494 RepID=UPI003646545B